MRADMMKLAVAFRNCFAKAPNNKSTSNFNAPRQLVNQLVRLVQERFPHSRQILWTSGEMCSAVNIPFHQKGLSVQYRYCNFLGQLIR